MRITEKDYCDYETCVALRELGYPLTSKEVRYEDKAVFVPSVLLYTVQKFLREEKKIDANAFYDNMDSAWRFYVLEIDLPDLSGTHSYNDAYMSYEEALSEGIKEAIKILKEK